MEQDLQALEQKRKDVADLRHIQITKRRPFMADHLERLAFIEETSVKTNMARTTGRPPRGQRLVDHAPFGRRHPQTFIRALRHDRSDAPWVIDGEMVGFYIKTQPVPTLRPGDAVIPDNRSGHKSPDGAQTVQDIAARFPLLPPYSPDLNSMEMAFPKLKTLKPKGRGADLRSAMASRRTCPRPLLGREMLQLLDSKWI